jgi:hypothetical protein
MISARSQINIGQPVSKVYAFVVTDFFKNYPRWSPEVVELEAIGAKNIALGSRGRQIRVDQGRRSETRFEVTELVDNKRAVFDGDLQAKFAIRYDFQSISDHECLLVFEFELKKLDFFMMPFQKLIKLAIQDGAERTIRNIKRLVEFESK